MSTNWWNEHLFVELFVKLDEYREEPSYVPLNKWILLLYTGSQVLTILHLLYAEKISNLLYLAVSPIAWLVGIIFIYPSLESSILLKNELKNGKLDYFFWRILFRGTALRKVYGPNYGLNINFSLVNVLTIIILVVSWTLWYIMSLRFADVYLKIASTFYMMLWGMALSVVVFTGLLSWKLYQIFRTSKPRHYSINEWIIEILHNKNEHSALKIFKEEVLDPLKRIFSVPLSITLRTWSVLGIATFSLGLIKKMDGYIPKTEIIQFQNTLALVMVLAFVIIVMFSYIIVRMSLKLKSILMLELREAKLQLGFNPSWIKMKFGQNYYSKIPMAYSMLVLEEMEKTLKEDELVLLSSKNAGEIIASIITVFANLGVFLLNLQH